MVSIAAERAEPGVGDSARPYPATSLAWYVVGVLAITSWVAYLDRMVITLLTPALKADLHLNDSGVGLLQGPAFSICFALAGLPLGRLVDRVNRRNIVVAGVVAWSLATLCSGLATNFWQLFVARMGLGIAEACLAPAAYSIVADYLKPSSRGRAMGILMGGVAFGTASSQIIGGLVLKALGGAATVTTPFLGEIAVWRLVFMLFSIPGFLVALLVTTMKEPPRRELATTTSQASVLPYLKRHAALYLPFLTGYSLNMLFVYAYLYWGPLVFVRTYGLSMADAGIMSGGMLVISGLVGGVGGGFISDAFVKRYPIDGRLRLVCVLVPVQIACVTLFSFGGSLLAATLAFGALKILSPLISGATNVVVQDLSPNQVRGQVVAVLALIGNVLGSTLGPMSTAFFTDYVYRDEKMVGASLLTVGMPSLIVSFILAIVAMKAIRRVNAEGPG